MNFKNIVLVSAIVICSVAAGYTAKVNERTIVKEIEVVRYQNCTSETFQFRNSFFKICEEENASSCSRKAIDMFPCQESK